MIFRQESFDIIGLCMEVHTQLGNGFLEIVYKDALEFEFKERKIQFAREREYTVRYKNVVLPHRFYADFVVMDKIILEIKTSTEGISDVFVAQAINYLKISGNKLALIINFGKDKLEFRRIVLTR